jgi:glycosyltransferase involved in cell wall biosynthesis
VVKKHGLFALINHLRTASLIRKIHVKSPIDLIETSELGFGLLPRNLPGKKIIRMSGGHTFFSISLGKKPLFWRKIVEQISFSKADAFCAVSRYVAETTRNLLNLGYKPITILPNPIDTTLFRPRPDINEEPGAILFAGTVTEKKGIRQLIDAMLMIKKAVPDAHLYVVGRDSHEKVGGRSFTEILRNNLPHELTDCVEFVGAVQNKDIPGWIARCQVCVYPSHMEAQGIVVIEAMSAGKAVVASQTGPGPELIDDGINGLLCDPFSPDSIAKKVILFLKNDEFRQTLAYQARLKAMKEFSIDTLITKNIDFYTSVK